MKPSSGRKMGVPAQTIVSIFTEKVLNRTAALSQLYLIFMRCRGRFPFHTRTERTQQRNSYRWRLWRRKWVRIQAWRQCSARAPPKWPAYLRKTVPPAHLVGNVAENVAAQKASKEKQTLQPVHISRTFTVQLKFLGYWLLTPALKNYEIRRGHLTCLGLGTGVKNISEGNPTLEDRRMKEEGHRVDHEGERYPLDHEDACYSLLEARIVSYVEQGSVQSQVGRLHIVDAENRSFVGVCRLSHPCRVSHLLSLLLFLCKNGCTIWNPRLMSFSNSITVGCSACSLGI